jgi:hypothetical protein
VRVSLVLRRMTFLLAGSVVPTAASSGQTISGHAVVAAPKHSAEFSGVTERMDGWWIGGEMGFEAGRLRLSASGMRGQLTAADPGSAPQNDVGEVSVNGHFRARPWLGLELRYTARALSSAAGYQRWNLLGVGATTSRELGTAAVRAFAVLQYFPLVSVSQQEEPSFGLGSDVGIAVSPSALPLAVTLSYRIERFTYPAAAARSEQFEALTLSLGLRARRRAGGWTLRGSAR